MPYLTRAAKRYAIPAVAFLFALGDPPAQLRAADDVHFSRDIQPILSERCFHCHGPDANAREADLRLDVRDAYVGDAASSHVVVPGRPEESPLFARVSTSDDDLRMPPPDHGDALTADEVATIRRWIVEGAVWEQHWSFTKPRRPPVPDGAESVWPKNTIDRFILRRLHAHDLAPSEEADQATLIRRASLDLIGRPPTPEEVDRFVADRRPDAYDRLVDRLLASPHYGERMAAEWLDAARYADSYGYQDDGETTMWRWRDWVIDAFNANMPFDQFTIEQLAGDLLPNPTFQQRVATAFNRNHRHNSEGGAIPEEFRVEYVVDRVATTATVWLGLTAGCARCHDHKYDPLTQREFYQLFAFFNNVPEDGRARKEGNTPPMMPAPTNEQQAHEAELKSQLRSVRQQIEDQEPEVAAAQRRWESRIDAATLPPFREISRELSIHLPLDGNAQLAAGDGGDLHVAATVPYSYVPGPVGKAVVLDGSETIDLGDVGSFSSDNRITLAVWIKPESANGTILSKIERPDEPQNEGYSLLLRDGRVYVNLISTWADDALRVETTTQVPLNRWTHLAVTYDGSHLARGIEVYFDGRRQPMRVEFDSLFQGFGNDGSLRLGTNGDPSRQFRGGLDDFRLYEVLLGAQDISLLAARGSVAHVLRIPETERTRNQRMKLRSYFLEHFAEAPLRQRTDRVKRLQDELALHQRSYPTLMVMDELPEPRPTYVLQRGQYDAHGEPVSAGIPAFFGAADEGELKDRLGLARWLVSPNNPLTARVAVNRLWQMSFNQGLVRTAEDFGVQGERPSHPELLDWLATELVENGWDLRAIRRLIVTSAAYRQRSQTTPELREADPGNTLLARGPRYRLPAETIRDSMLAASGLLTEDLGGPSVKPYQPAGLWEEISDESYQEDSGQKLYRRSLYIFWKRTVTHPLMSVLDAPSREICTVREDRSNTPLQALALLNETGMVEAARCLAERAMRESGRKRSRQLRRAFRLATARSPRRDEIELLEEMYDRHLQHYAADGRAAEKLLAVGQRPRDEHFNQSELAAMTAISNMLLNLDETVTQH